MAGLFISLEGVEGAGKTTLIQKMVAYFGRCGKEVLHRSCAGTGKNRFMRPFH